MSATIVHVFHVARLSGDAVILHPFRIGSPVFRHPSSVRLEGRYGRELSEREAASLRTTLYTEIERSARADALDKGFPFRILASALAFIAMYLFFGLVVRERIPFPFIMAVSFLAAISTWFGIERRTLSSQALSGRIAEVKRLLDSAIFIQSPAVMEFESLLDGADSVDSSGVSDYIRAASVFSEERPGGSEDKEELRQAIRNRLTRSTKPDGSGTLESVAPEDLPRELRRFRKSDRSLAMAYARMVTKVGAAT